jgi:hypothetical protein
MKEADIQKLLNINESNTRNEYIVEKFGRNAEYTQNGTVWLKKFTNDSATTQTRQLALSQFQDSDE